MRAVRITLLSACLLLVVLLWAGCTRPSESATHLNANDHGVLTGNTGAENSRALQALIDHAAMEGKTVYIPAGEYEFAANGTQTIGSHCVKMRSGVSIVGDGERTVLKPVGHTLYGLDMFYFNDYLDTGVATYLENCSFEHFVIDASGTSVSTYTSAGKGFMFNLFQNCHWRGVTVKNTDATGFGVDCPIDSSITDCVAIGCGKAATNESSGASGFGIGFGYRDGESITITRCTAEGNKKFGFFLEHQGRFSSQRYPATAPLGFAVRDCTASRNLYGFGGICTVNTVYEGCTAENSRRYGFYFEDSAASGARQCESRGEGEACFAVSQSIAPATPDADIFFTDCTGENAPVGLLLIGAAATAQANGCSFTEVTEERVLQGQH
ncbi:MAG: hypothetical protein E7644_02045 [Ruminococcaceae bacterium]|nr:hypothetical protein [Oscillospiraceae bacterium]